MIIVTNVTKIPIAVIIFITFGIVICLSNFISFTHTEIFFDSFDFHLLSPFLFKFFLFLVYDRKENKSRKRIISHIALLHYTHNPLIFLLEDDRSFVLYLPVVSRNLLLSCDLIDSSKWFIH